MFLLHFQECSYAAAACNITGSVQAAWCARKATVVLLRRTTGHACCWTAVGMSLASKLCISQSTVLQPVRPPMMQTKEVLLFT